MKTTRREREYQKESMRNLCTRLSIEIPENANKRQLEAAFDAYYKDAAVVHSEDGVALRQTDKPTAEYGIMFTLYVYHLVRAESEDAAIKWIRENAADYYRPDHGEVLDSGDVQIIDIAKEEEE